MAQVSVDPLLRTALQHHQAGRAAEAEALYRQILARQPDQPVALHLLGVLAGQAGRLDEAVELIRRALASSPTEAAYHSNLGKFLLDKGELEAAVEACRKAVALQPEFAEGHYNLGNALHVNGKAEEAAAAYREALRIRPDLLLARKNLGTALKDLGRLDEAIAIYQETLRFKPDWPEVHGLLGAVLRANGENDAAIAAFGHALRFKPGDAEISNNLGNALQAAGQLDEAVTCYREALRQRPDLAEAHNNLGSALKEQGLVDEAVACHRRAVALMPQNAALHSNLLLALNYQISSTRRSLFEEAQVWAGVHAAPLAGSIKVHANAVDPDRKLRIGYVSADFRRHASAFFLMPLLSHHDPRNVEAVCYADVPRPDEISRQLRQHAAIWRETAELPDARLAEMIREDRIDILVDLKLHADHNRLLVFARKPAPIQVTWLGYPGTTGMGAIDYRLSDPHLDPPGQGDAFYSEETYRLPETFWCYDPLAAAPAVNGLPTLSSGRTTFGCLNHFSKLSDPLLHIWAQVLNAVPGSRIMLLAAEGSHRARVIAALSREGILPGRIEFALPRPRAEYLQLYHGIDIGLDSWPVNGHTTTFDALWMGVPVITLAGPTALGRAGVSQLTNLNLSEFIAQSAEHYVRLAAELAADLPRLAELRAALRPRMQGSALMEGPRFARHMETAYRNMWIKWCRRFAG